MTGRIVAAVVALVCFGLLLFMGWSAPEHLSLISRKNRCDLLDSSLYLFLVLALLRLISKLSLEIGHLVL